MFSSGDVCLEICGVFFSRKGVHPSSELAVFSWTLVVLVQYNPSVYLRIHGVIFAVAAVSSFGGAIGGFFPEVGDVFLVVCFLVLGLRSQGLVVLF